MVRPPLMVLAPAVVITALALVVLTAGGSFPATLVWSLWALWGVATLGGGVVHFIARRTDRL